MEREISRAVYQYLLAQVPCGRVTHYEAICDYVSSVFGEPIYDCNGMIRVHNSAEWDILLAKVPFHREVSLSGMLSRGTDEDVKKLIAEGHTIVPYSKTNNSPKIKNVKNVWFDFDKEANVDPNILRYIDRKMSCVEYLSKD